MHRIHIVGAQRSGTTLLHVIMGACFDIGGATDRECSVFSRVAPGHAVTCTKNPPDIRWARLLLPCTRRLWFVCLVRDPRDVIVSRYHSEQVEGYYVNLRLWKQAYRRAMGLRGHPRFIVVRYEELVRDPAAVQAHLMERLPFLTKRADFATFHEGAETSDAYREGMHGLRPLSADTLGAWRQHKPRVLAQLHLHGEIDGALREQGYESDAAWRRELDGVVPDNQVSYYPDRWGRLFQLKRTLVWWRETLRGLVGGRNA